MKILKLTILFSILALPLVAQNNTLRQQKERLVNEIKAFDYIESRCLGFACNSSSILYKKADSLFKISTQDDAIKYFDDTVSSLKYYSFVRILEFDDVLAYKLLKNNITNETRVDYQFADVTSNAKLTILLGLKYQDFIKSKYYFGGLMCQDQKCFQFPLKNRKVYKKKKKELEELFATNSMKLH